MLFKIVSRKMLYDCDYKSIEIGREVPEILSKKMEKYFKLASFRHFFTRISTSTQPTVEPRPHSCDYHSGNKNRLRVIRVKLKSNYLCTQTGTGTRPDGRIDIVFCIFCSSEQSTYDLWNSSGTLSYGSNYKWIWKRINEQNEPPHLGVLNMESTVINLQ